LGSGGIVDIEFLVQYLQLRHGRTRPRLRTPNTLEALRTLAADGLISASDATELEASYLFLRRVENRLRILSDRAIDALPSSPEKINNLAKRMGYQDRGGGEAGQDLLSNLESHRRRVRKLLQLVFERESH
jgi:glutamate-ammonia-ligase adenylyltransferase